MTNELMVWFLLFKTGCGALSFLADAPTCWRDTGYHFSQQAECEDMIKTLPANHEFKCTLSMEQKP